MAPWVFPSNRALESVVWLDPFPDVPATTGVRDASSGPASSQLPATSSTGSGEPVDIPSIEIRIRMESPIVITVADPDQPSPELSLSATSEARVSDAGWECVSAPSCECSSPPS